MDRWTMLRRFFALTLAALTACSEPTTAPQFEASQPSLNETPTATLLECRRADSDFASALIGPLGSVLSLDGHQLIVHEGALLNLAFVTMREPPTRFVEVELRVNGQPHFTFQKPVTVVLDYSRCRRRRLPEGALRVFEIDPVTKALIREMEGAIDDRASRTIRFDTDHFSGYAVAQ
jgi:hypothetical protein